MLLLGGNKTLGAQAKFFSSEGEGLFNKIKISHSCKLPALCKHCSCPTFRRCVAVVSRRQTTSCT